MAKNKKTASPQDKESAFEAIVKKFKQSPGIYIGSVVILLLVIVTFLGGDLLSGGGFGAKGDDLTFGYYDKAPISYVPGNFFSQNYDNIYRYYQNYFQSQGISWDDMDQFSQLMRSSEIWRMAYEGALAHTAVLEIMKRSGYDIPQNIVDREVARLPQFQENGRFSSALYNQLSESSRLSVWRQTREDLIKMKYFSDLFDISIPKGEAEFIAAMASPLRNYEMVAFSVEDYPESEYISYARNNASLFNSIHMSRITVSSSERDARRVLSSVMNGTTTFEDAARNQSTDFYASTGGDMGNRYFYELDREIPSAADRSTVYSLRAGEISDIVATTDGWSFFRIESGSKQADFSDEILMEKVRSYVRGFERGRMEDWAISVADNFIRDAVSSDFEEAAFLWNLERDSFGPLAINYGSVDLFSSLESFSVNNISSSDLKSLAFNENFWKTIITAPLNTPSRPLVQGNAVLVFIPVEEAPADVQFTESIEQMYSGWWLNYVAEQLIQQYFVNNERTADNFWETFFQYFMPF